MLCTVPDAFSAVESTRALTEAIYSLAGITNLLRIPTFCLIVLESNPAAFKKLQASAEFQRTFLNCFLVLEPLPGQLSRLLTLSNEGSESSPPSSLIVTVYNDMIVQVTYMAAKLVSFIEKKGLIDSAFSLVSVAVFSTFLAKTLHLAGDLIAASQALLNASILGDFPIQCLLFTAVSYVERAGIVLFMCSVQKARSEADYYAAVDRILSPATWVRPFFLGVDGLIKRSKERKDRLKEIEISLSLCHFFLGSDLIAIDGPKQRYVEQTSSPAAVLDSPALQTEAKKYLIDYSACIANVYPPLETDIAPSVQARILDVYAYG